MFHISNGYITQHLPHVKFSITENKFQDISTNQECVLITIHEYKRNPIQHKTVICFKC